MTLMFCSFERYHRDVNQVSIDGYPTGLRVPARS
jgi:hypothetical protein